MISKSAGGAGAGGAAGGGAAIPLVAFGAAAALETKTDIDAVLQGQTSGQTMRGRMKRFETNPEEFSPGEIEEMKSAALDAKKRLDMTDVKQHAGVALSSALAPADMLGKALGVGPVSKMVGAEPMEKKLEGVSKAKEIAPEADRFLSALKKMTDGMNAANLANPGAAERNGPMTTPARGGSQ
jgi:hypothetical protein